MGRSLSNLNDAEFDALVVTDKVTAKNVEAQGDFAHTGDTPAEFQDLNIGTPSAVGNLVVIRPRGPLRYVSLFKD